MAVFDPEVVKDRATFTDPHHYSGGITGPYRVRGGGSGRCVGPNVTLEAGTVVEASEIENTVVGPEARISGANLHDSIIGGHARISKVSGSLRVTDHSVVAG